MRCVLAGFQHKDYLSKASGKQVQGTNLFFVCPSSYDDVQGQEVCTEFVRPEILQGVNLAPGGTYELEYGKGYGGKAVVTSITQVIAPTNQPAKGA